VRECDDENQRELSAIRKANGGDSVGHIDSNAEKNVPASRKGSSTLMSTRSLVNDASISSRCSARMVTSSVSTSVYDQNASVGICVSMVTGPLGESEWTVGSEESYLERDVGVH